VIHHATSVRERLGNERFAVIWLVARERADFDTHTALYLIARLVTGYEQSDWPSAVIGDDGSKGETEEKLSWLGAGYIGNIPGRWAIVLARYAAHVDNARRVFVPREQALHSILYACYQRGRPFWTTGSGPTILFDEATRIIGESGRDPLFDVVLNPTGEFEPEFALLTRESEAYKRDLRRSRQTIVHVPVLSESHTFRDALTRVESSPLIDADGTITPIHMQAMDVGKKREFDGLFLRDPECILFKEWARLDVDGSSLHRGFTFTFIAKSNGLQHGEALNKTNYVIALDPLDANGAHLYTLWVRLQAAEINARQAGNVSLNGVVRPGFEGRAGAFEDCFIDPWFDGAIYDGTLISTPRHGTLISTAGTSSDCMDDAIAQLVVAELELSIYQEQSHGFDVSTETGECRNFSVDLKAQPQRVPIDAHTYRLVNVELHDDVKLGHEPLIEQIDTVLWDLLHPGDDPVVPPKLRTRSFRHGNLIGVWSRSGIAMAHKPSATRTAQELAVHFKTIVECAGAIRALVADLEVDNDDRDRSTVTRGPSERRELNRQRMDRTEKIMLRIIRTQQDLATPEGRLITNFLAETGLDELGTTLRDISVSKKMDGQQEASADTQGKLDWLQLLFIGVYGTDVANIFSTDAVPEQFRLLVTTISTALITIVAALFLRPWKPESKTNPKLFIGALGALFIVALGFGVFRAIIPSTMHPLSPEPIATAKSTSTSQQRK
jgi:hypothetical protein